jgi:catechol 2,3-dioxygenase-like lactoylglutathione lyase family enzyme
MAILNPRFLSHGTLESRDLERSRKFYEDFLGLEVIRTSDRSLMIRLGGHHVYAVVENTKKPEMPVLNHNGLDVPSREEVDKAHEIAVAEKDKWGIKKITRPVDAHGTYGFYIADPDDNWWEILTNPDGGYSWMFNKGDDIDSWGAGEEKGFNPNDFTRVRPKKKAEPASS